jgi:hypothetical protein
LEQEPVSSWSVSPGAGEKIAEERPKDKQVYIFQVMIAKTITTKTITAK